MSERSIPTSQPVFAILIPVYNHKESLPLLLEQLQRLATQQDTPLFKIVVVDDGSHPPVEIPKLSGDEITLIRHPLNYGKGAALLTGFKYILEEPEIQGIITIDGDLQHPPEYIPRFFQAFVEKEGDIIIGARERIPGVMPLHRILSNLITSWIISTLVGQKVPDSQCGFRLYSRQVLENLSFNERRFHLESEILIRAGWKKFRFYSVPIPTIYHGAPSAIRNMRDTLNFVTLIFRLLKERMQGYV